MSTMKDILAGEGFNDTEEVIVPDSRQKHRGTTIKERPSSEFKLLSVNEEDFERKKTQAEPTEDLVYLPKGNIEAATSSIGSTGYLVWCDNTLEMWYAPTKLCLDANFIYRSDLEICEIESHDNGVEFYHERSASLLPGVITRKVCYILDNPAGECYEVYYDTNYPSVKYGKATPSGMFVYKYDDRFQRDMAIMELDKLYTDTSKTNAKALVERKLKANEAIIISDGAWMKEVCSSAIVYIDDTRLVQQTHAANPSDKDQAVLIAEITGATLALQMCKLYNKKNITYYYDNTSIVNVFKNRKTEYIDEIKAYKQLLTEMDSLGYRVQFVELHPKTGENKDSENKALCFFHNNCDRACREISDIFKKDYISNATLGSRDGKGFDDIKKQPPKGIPRNKPNNGNRQGNGYKPNNGYNQRRY